MLFIVSSTVSSSSLFYLLIILSTRFALYLLVVRSTRVLLFAILFLVGVLVSWIGVFVVFSSYNSPLMKKLL